MKLLDVFKHLKSLLQSIQLVYVKDWNWFEHEKWLNSSLEKSIKYATNFIFRMFFSVKNESGNIRV